MAILKAFGQKEWTPTSRIPKLRLPSPDCKCMYFYWFSLPETFLLVACNFSWIGIVYRVHANCWFSGCRSPTPFKETKKVKSFTKSWKQPKYHLWFCASVVCKTQRGKNLVVRCFAPPNFFTLPPYLQAYLPPISCLSHMSEQTRAWSSTSFCRAYQHSLSFGCLNSPALRLVACWIRRSSISLLRKRLHLANFWSQICCILFCTLGINQCLVSCSKISTAHFPCHGDWS